MELPERLQDALRKMTYATQFSRPMVKGVERTMSAIVWPFLYKFEPEQYLVEISSLLNSGCLLSKDIFTDGRSEDEVRSYLVELAAEIERSFEEVGRSNIAIKRGGTWRCVEFSNQSKDLKAGEVLPLIQGEIRTWKLEKELRFNSAFDAFVHEMATYYNRRTLGNMFGMVNIEECAKFSSQRIIGLISSSDRMKLAEFLEKMVTLPNMQNLETLNKSTEINWMKTKESWAFLTNFTLLLGGEIRKSISLMS